MHGKDVSIPEGHEVTVYTNTDYKVDPRKFPVQTTAISIRKVSGAALTNSDILKLKSAGLSDELIIQKIGSSPANYKLDPDDLAKLKQLGLSDSVIGAMLSAQNRQQQ